MNILPKSCQGRKKPPPSLPDVYPQLLLVHLIWGPRPSTAQLLTPAGSHSLCSYTMQINPCVFTVDLLLFICLSLFFCTGACDGKSVLFIYFCDSAHVTEYLCSVLCSGTCDSVSVSLFCTGTCDSVSVFFTLHRDI